MSLHVYLPWCFYCLYFIVVFIKHGNLHEAIFQCFLTKSDSDEKIIIYRQAFLFVWLKMEIKTRTFACFCTEYNSKLHSALWPWMFYDVQQHLNREKNTIDLKLWHHFNQMLTFCFLTLNSLFILRSALHSNAIILYIINKCDIHRNEKNRNDSNLTAVYDVI